MGAPWDREVTERGDERADRSKCRASVTHSAEVISTAAIERFVPRREIIDAGNDVRIDLFIRELAERKNPSSLELWTLAVSANPFYDHDRRSCVSP